MERVGATLRECRTRAGFSQEELAHRLHISQSDVSKYENDSKEPSLSIAYAWANSTHSQEIMVAFMFGLDGIGFLQSLLDSGISEIGMILFNIIGGIF